MAHAVAKMPRGPLIDAKHYDIFQSAGLHVRPVHFYSPIPNTAELDQALWDTPSEMPGVNQNLDGQCRLLHQIGPFLQEYYSLPEHSEREDQFARIGGFGDEDGAILYSMIRKFQPSRMIEIGAGKSTVLSTLALETNGNMSAHLTAIDPFPQKFLKNHIRPRVDIVAKKIEDIPISVFGELESNDILFIDSSHTVRIGGDVLIEILEILPRLKPGVIVHIHDIFLPNHYPKEWVMDRHVFWAEQYVVQAFLAFNSAFEILWGYNMICASRKDQLSCAILARKPEFGNGSSLWLRKIR